MTHAGDWKALLSGGGGEKCAGTAEENALQFAFCQLAQQFSAQCDGAASTAGTAGMDILLRIVKYQGAAIRQLPADQDARLPA